MLSVEYTAKVSQPYEDQLVRTFFFVTHYCQMPHLLHDPKFIFCIPNSPKAIDTKTNKDM